VLRPGSGHGASPREDAIIGVPAPVFDGATFDDPRTIVTIGYPWVTPAR
jgi:hypothetical protein